MRAGPGLPCARTRILPAVDVGATLFNEAGHVRTHPCRRPCRKTAAERLLLHDGSRLKSPEERKELKEIVTEFLDDCPQWALKGWSIEEVREAQRMSDRQYLNVVDLLDPIPGEDDLCPCGSGKLFRKCHGRGN